MSDDQEQVSTDEVVLEIHDIYAELGPDLKLRVKDEKGTSDE